MDRKPDIVAVHLLNDFSGSPLVFVQALEGLQKSGHKVYLHTSQGREGFLDRLHASRINIPYKFYPNSVLRLIAFCFSQFILFLQILRYYKKDVVIYVNTLLPFGAALAGKITGKKVIYHLHESYIQPASLKRFLKGVASACANTALYVSKYLFDTEKLNNVESEVIHNALPDEFVNQARLNQNDHIAERNFTVLMVCSLKIYKGIPEFIEMAKRNPSLNFELVVNATESEINSFFDQIPITSNVNVFPAQKNLHPFYSRAALVVNLTNPSLCIETFGLTILEAMCYGIPVIAPPVGGPAEIVVHGDNGFTIDVRDSATLDQTIEMFSKNESMRSALSRNAFYTSSRFLSTELQRKVNAAVSRL